MNGRLHSGATRTGITTSESVAAFVAVVAGVGIGLAVLRPDLLDTLLNDSTGSLTQRVPAMREPVESPPQETDSDPVLDELRRLREEVRTLRDEPSAYGSGAPGGEAEGQPSSPRHDSRPRTNQASRGRVAMGRRTLSYWNQLNQIMAKEEQMRSVPVSGLTAANASDFLRRRGEAGKYAQDAIQSLSATGVDPDVVRHAADIAAWYGRGNDLNSMGSFLLNDADEDTRRGHAGTSWGESEKQHHKSVDSLNRRGDELRDQMIERYGIEFPDLL